MSGGETLGGPVVVTGAGGFVCSEICVALARAGREVIALDQVFDAASLARLSGVRVVEGALPEVLAGLSGAAPAMVIHGAAITAAPEQVGLSRAGHLRANVDALTGVLDWARGAGAGRFVFLSSMGVFAAGDADGGVVTEATLPTGDCPYAAAKRAGEIVTAAAAEPGFATLSLRLGNIFGPHEAARETRQVVCLLARMIAEAAARGVIPVETPDALREWAWLPDLATGIAALCDGWPEGVPVLHAGTPPALTDLEVARAIAERMGGVTIRLAPPPHPAIRPPMASAHPGALGQAQWTDIGTALDRLIPAGVAP